MTRHRQQAYDGELPGCAEDEAGTVLGTRLPQAESELGASRGPARRGDSGSASVLVLSLALALSVLAALLTVLGAVAVARHRATAGADLAALAAAGRVLEGSATACGRAEELARAQDSRLVGCELTGDVVEVVVEVRPPGWLGRFGTARGRARAGPADPPPG